MDTPQDLKNDAMNPESKYTSCPYNTSHRILRARMQYHLVKCKRTVKEKPEEEKSICPFDATHHVDKEEFEEHVKTCPNRKIIDSEKYAIESEEKKESEPAASYVLPDLPPCEENWDDPSEPAYTYNPQVHLENQPILRTMHGATKSERKAFRQVERMKMIQFNSGQPMDPTAAAAAVAVSVSKGRVLGRGRGKDPRPLGYGDSVGSIGEKVDLDKVVGDGVGHFVPCQVESGPLRKPKISSVVLEMAKKAEETPDSSMEFPPLPPSAGAIRKMKQPARQEEKPASKGGQGVGGRPECTQQKNIDWWDAGAEAARGKWNSENGKILNDYKEMKKNIRLAAKLGVIEPERDDDARAKAFTFEDEEWQIQGRRSKYNRGYGRNY